MLTSGSLFALQEFLASWIANDRGKHGYYFNSRIPKMALYGVFISAPLGHFLIGMLQWVFAGRTSLKAKILQILTSNLIVRSPYLHWSRFIIGREITNRQSFSADLAHPEYSLPCLYGPYRRRTNVSPGPCHRQGGVHARDEG